MTHIVTNVTIKTSCARIQKSAAAILQALEPEVENEAA